MREVIAELLRQGGSIVSMLIRTREVRRQQPREEAAPDWMGDVQPNITRVEMPEIQQWRPKQLTAPSKPTQAKIATTPESAKSFKGQEEIDYRFECCSKHLGIAVGTLKEGLDRAIDNGMADPGVKQKVREAMIALNAMEPDIEAMIGIPEASNAVEWLQSGQRNFRKAIWESGLERGKGSIEDLRNAHKWVAILLNRVYEEVEAHPGEACKEIL